MSCPPKQERVGTHASKNRGAENARWKGGTGLNGKGYPRIWAGPLRGQYLHRVVAEAMLGRELRPDEEVHHRDKDKLNFGNYILKSLER